MSAVPTRVRPNPVFARLLLGACVLAVPLVCVGWWSLHSAAQHSQDHLARLLAETDAADPGWRWDDLQAARPALPDERNGWTVIDRCIPAEAPLAPAAIPTRPEPLAEVVAWNRQTVRTHLEFDPEEAAVRTRARSLRDFPEGRTPYAVTPKLLLAPLPHLDRVRQAFALLEGELEAEASAHRPHAGADVVRALFHCAGVLRDDPWLLSQQNRLSLRMRGVRIVERLLGMTEPDDATLTRLQQLLEAEARERPLVVGLRGERALMTLLFDGLSQRQITLDEVRQVVRSPRHDSGWDPLGGLLVSQHLANDQHLLLQGYNAALIIAAAAPELQVAAWERLDRDLLAARAPTEAGPRHLLAGGLLPSFERLGNWSVRDRALLECAVAAVAVERYRRARQRWPGSLADLVPDYLPRAPLDLYTGQPLVYRRAADGVTLYSVNRNGVDDGGECLFARGPEVPNADLGVRLWAPPHRRLPPWRPPEAGPAFGEPLHEEQP